MCCECSFLFVCFGFFFQIASYEEEWPRFDVRAVNSCKSI